MNNEAAQPPQNHKFMKKIIVRQICLTLAMSFLCFSVHGKLSAQAVRVSLDMEDVTMEKVMTEIEKQTRYLFGSDKDVDLTVKVTVIVDNAPLAEALDQMVKGTDIRYTISDSYILLSRHSGQELRLAKGRITDAGGNPLIGAMVYDRDDRTISAVTDLDGRFEIEVPDGDMIVVSLLGFKEMEIPASSATANMSLTLQEDISTLDEVVVVGYGVQKKVNVTGSVSQIKAEEMADRPVMKMTQALQGQQAREQPVLGKGSHRSVHSFPVSEGKG